MARSSDRQPEFYFPSWGGPRKGAGRPKNPEGSVSHTRRPALAARYPVHVTLRIAAGLPPLRNGAVYRAVKGAFCNGRERFGFRLVHYSVMSNHAHLVVEAQDTRSLTRGMQGLCVRMARALNRLWGRKGKVFAQRFHAHMLRTPREVRCALGYVLRNARIHGVWLRPGAVDPFSSGRRFDGWKGQRWSVSWLVFEQLPIAKARTWLLSVGWMLHGLIPVERSPASRKGGRRARATCVGVITGSDRRAV